MIRGLLFVVLLLTLRRVSGGDELVNRAEYQELCKFIQILESKPEIPRIKLEGTTDNIPTLAEKLLKDIELLNVSTTEDEVFQLLERGEGFKEASINPTVKGIDEKDWTGLITIWKANKGKSDQDVSKIRRPPNTKTRFTAHRQIGKLLALAKQAANRVNEAGRIMEENIRAARKHMYSAIYGRATVDAQTKTPEKAGDERDGETDPFGGIEPRTTSFGDGASSTYAKVCGEEGSASPIPGTSIISDMTCLCADKATARASHYCGASVAPATLTGDYSIGDLPKAGKELKEHCPKPADTHKVSPTPESLHGIIGRFRALLGKNRLHASGDPSYASGHQQNNQFILGAFVAGGAKAKCEGGASITNTQATGVCVNYVTILGNGKEVPWITEIQKAAERLQENKGNFTLQLSLFNKLESLKTSAEVYYEDALTGLNYEGSTQTTIHPAKTGNESKSTTAQATSTEKEGAHSGLPSEFGKKYFATVIFLLLATRF